MPRSPKGRAAARGLDARLSLQHAFMPAGDASLKTLRSIKMLIDSNHGIYRDLQVGKENLHVAGGSVQPCVRPHMMASPSRADVGNP